MIDDRERQHEVPVECNRDPSKRVDPVLRTATFFEPRDHRLGCLHPLCELALTQPGLGAHVVDELTEIKVLVDRRSRFG